MRAKIHGSLLVYIGRQTILCYLQRFSYRHEKAVSSEKFNLVLLTVITGSTQLGLLTLITVRYSTCRQKSATLLPLSHSRYMYSGTRNAVDTPPQVVEQPL